MKKIMHTKKYTKQVGVTLVELMVAMAVSSVIMLGVSNIYVSTKKSYVIHDEFARIQENGRYALDILSTDIRNAGYFGCSSGQPQREDGSATIKNGLNGVDDVTFNLQTAVFGFDAVGTDIGTTTVMANPIVESGTPADWITAAGLTTESTDAFGGFLSVAYNPVVPAQVAARAIPGSDIIILRTTAPLGVNIAENNDSAQVFLDDTTGGFVADACSHNTGSSAPAFRTDGISGICEGDVLLISDCVKSRVFRAMNMTQKAGGAVGACGKPSLPCFNLTHNAGPNSQDNKAPPTWKDQDTYGPDAEIIKIITKTYFIGTNPGGAPAITEPTLYVRNDDGVPDPLIEGVENMQILYGVDTNGDGSANQYFSANNVPDVDNPGALAGETTPGLHTTFDGVVSVKISLLVRTPQDMPGINRTPADYANLTYNLISPASPIIIDPIQVDAASTDRRMRRVYNLTIKIRNR